jgi:hypothetical protein
MLAPEVKKGNRRRNERERRLELDERSGRMQGRRKKRKGSGTSKLIFDFAENIAESEENFYHSYA